MDFRRLKNSFKYAWTGFKENHRREQNFRIQLMISIFVIFLALTLRLDWLRLAILFLTCTSVLSLEMMNSGLERYIDKLTPQRDENIGRAKDVLAGAVLVASIMSIPVGIVVFYQPIMDLIR